MKSIIVFIASIVALSAGLIMLDRSRFGSGPSDWAWQYPTNESPQPFEGAAPTLEESSGGHRSPADPEPRASPGARSDIPQPRTTRPNTTVEPETWALSRLRSAGARTEILRCVRGVDFFGLSESEQVTVRLRFGNHQPLHEPALMEEIRGSSQAADAPAYAQSLIATVENGEGRTVGSFTANLVLAIDSTVLAIVPGEPDHDADAPRIPMPERGRIGDGGTFPGGGWMLERGSWGHARLVVYLTEKGEGFLSSDFTTELWIEIDRAGFARVVRFGMQDGFVHFLAERS
jgi:hypothetical protein